MRLTPPATVATIWFMRSNWALAAKGIPSTKVITPIDMMVPIPNRERYPRPTQKESIVGNNASITKALPARP